MVLQYDDVSIDNYVYHVLIVIVIIFIIIIIKKKMMESIGIDCLVYDENIVGIMMRFIGLNITLFLNYYYYIVNILSIIIKK